MEPRWMRLYSAPRQPQAPRTVDNQLRQHSEQEVKAWKTLWGTPVACEADAPQALSAFAQGWQATLLHHSTLHATPR